MFPTVLSFIVPAYNEEFELPETLAAIQGAAQDRHFEIIVVDDASTDATPAIAKEMGARVIAINRRQIAAARNAGVLVAKGDILFFVDADTRIKPQHVTGAVAALGAGCSGGSARVEPHGPIPRWGRIFLKVFSAVYFWQKLGAGAFLFTTRKNFNAIGGLDETLFIGEEVFFSLALKKLGRFTILDEPIVTSGRKLRMYSGRELFGRLLPILFGGMRTARSRSKLDLWYDGKRETEHSFAQALQQDEPT
jgi:glycosyltransferase involved in cell wall biosynthesis